MSVAAHQPVAEADGHAVAFKFVEALARDLSSGKLELPAFPDVATRVRQALADETVNLAQVVRIVGSEPTLAARVLKMANSAALNRTGRPITELRTAIARMGHDAVRSTALAFAMAQIRSSDRLKGLEKPLGLWWKRTTRIAAVSYVIAKNASGLSPDEAFLGGLLHGVGQLYIYTRTPDFPALLGDPASLAEILGSWHTGVARAIVENWGIDDKLVEAIGEQDNFDRDHEGDADLADVLIAAKWIASCPIDEADLSYMESEAPAIARLGLTAERRLAFLAESEVEIDALRSAIGP
jgi:HD-like signal output (HDOD) protein